MMVKVKGPIPSELTESTRLRIALPFYQWATIVAAILACGGYLANLNMRFNRTETVVGQNTRRLDYQTAVLISKGIMSPQEFQNVPQ